MTEVDGALSFAVALARQAGALMKENFSLGMQKEWKEDSTPLTVTDQKINTLVLESIRSTYSTHSIIAEEGSQLTDSEYVWVCDPIDGTIPFSHGYPTFVFSLALTKNGESILGVVYDPICNRLFTAEKGKGAFLNEKKISVSTAADFSKACFVGLDGENRLPTLRAQLREKGARVVNVYSCVYLSMLVASGEFAAEIFGNSTPWDAAAVKIIVEEAGGKVTGLRGEEQRYDQPTNGFIASNGILHQKLVDLVQLALE